MEEAVQWASHHYYSRNLSREGPEFFRAREIRQTLGRKAPEFYKINPG